MKMFWTLACKSLVYRRHAIGIAIVSISVSVFLLLSLDHSKHAMRKSFNGTISGVDLIVGPRTSDVNLLLSTVFRIGVPTHNMSWTSYRNLAQNRDVAWAIPIALGDSHRGYRVVGTEKAFFDYYRYAQSRQLGFTQGRAFEQPYDVVLGAQVANQLGYTLQREITIAHGIAQASFQRHDRFPFKVVGILAATGTPVDNALYVTLGDLEAIHGDSESKRTPDSITAAFIGLKSKLATFKIQRQIKESVTEPLTAIIPGVALTQLWQITRGIENSLQIISLLVLACALLGLAAVLLATVRERNPELKVLRSLGARPWQIILLVQMEAVLVTLLSFVLAIISLWGITVISSDWVMVEYGVDIGGWKPNTNTLYWASIVIGGASVLATLPALACYRRLNIH